MFKHLTINWYHKDLIVYDNHTTSAIVHCVLDRQFSEIQMKYMYVKIKVIKRKQKETTKKLKILS